MRFSYKELLSLKEEVGEIGEDTTVHVNHCKVGAGNDRCYVTNKGDCHLFYCHHCGKAGRLSTNLATYKRKIKPKKASLPRSYMLPTTAEKNISLWPIEARMWPQRASLTREQVEEVGMAYDTVTQRVCLPVTFDETYRGYVARRITGDGPKYLARRNDINQFMYVKHAEPTQHVILVEDILSCIKLYYAGYNAVALQGTSIDDTLLNYVTKRYNSFTIWLDNDNPQVIMNQVKLQKKLELFGTTRIVKTDKDPKEYNEKEIERCLKK